MPFIPPEIKNEIFSYITDRADSFNLRAVDKSFQAQFTPAAFHTVTFRNTFASIDRLKTSLAGSNVTQHVQHLLFILDDSHLQVDGLIPDGCALGPNDVKDIPHGAFSCSLSFPNVHSVSARFPATSNTFRRPAYTEYRLRMQYIFLQTIEKCPAIRTLHLKNVCLSSDMPAGLRLALAHLDQLTIDLGQPWLKPRVYGYGYRTTICQLTEEWLKPAEANLSSLSFGSASNKYVLPAHFSPSGLTFQRLRSLSLDHVYFETRSNDYFTGFAELIISPSIAATLQELRLGGCALAVQRHISDGTWGAIFAKFREKLGVLRRFEIVVDLFYVFRSTTSFKMLRMGSTLTNDREELNRLWQSIGQGDRALPEENKWVIGEDAAVEVEVA